MTIAQTTGYTVITALAALAGAGVIHSICEVLL